MLNGTHQWLHDMVNPSLRDPVGFWKKMESLPDFKGKVPGNARRGLEKMMPARGLDSARNSEYRIVHRVAGMGSLGRAALRRPRPVCRRSRIP